MVGVIAKQSSQINQFFDIVMYVAMINDSSFNMGRLMHQLNKLFSCKVFCNSIALCGIEIEVTKNEWLHTLFKIVSNVHNNVDYFIQVTFLRDVN